jgi:hypothetical protein
MTMLGNFRMQHASKRFSALLHQSRTPTRFDRLGSQCQPISIRIDRCAALPLDSNDDGIESKTNWSSTHFAL